MRKGLALWHFSLSASAEPDMMHLNMNSPLELGEGGINQQFGINIYKTVNIKQITSKDLLYSTRNYIQHLAIIYKGKESEKEYINMYTCILYIHICIYIYMHACCLVSKSGMTLHDPMDCSTSGFPILHYLLEFAQICVR